MRKQGKRYIFQVTLNEADMNSIWLKLEQRYNSNESDTWRKAAEDALILGEITAAAAKKGISDILLNLKSEA